jgi:hypothetical protein
MATSAWRPLRVARGGSYTSVKVGDVSSRLKLNDALADRKRRMCDDSQFHRRINTFAHRTGLFSSMDDLARFCCRNPDCNLYGRRDSADRRPVAVPVAVPRARVGSTTRRIVGVAVLPSFSPRALVCRQPSIDGLSGIDFPMGIRVSVDQGKETHQWKSSK